MKLWGRSRHQDAYPVTDLDAIVVEPVPFRFRGKIHTLKVTDLRTFLRFTNAQAALMKTTHEEIKISARDLAKRYHDVISPLCSTITVDDILDMEQVQIAALYQLVIDLVTGQVDFGGEDSKKKRLRLPIYDSVAPSLSPSAPENSAGHPEKH